MSETLSKIEIFIGKHHVMTLATSRDNQPQSCNLFYAYIPEEVCFIVASDRKTEHIQNIIGNSDVAGTIVLETKTVGKIEGLQFKAKMMMAEDDEVESVYFAAFPYARVLNPTLWKIIPSSMKLTDNRLGFGKKLNWTRAV
ncbi:MAG: pyridoxamine 5'-phosphate oxidase family protein [Campylobacterota bacterium]|nr:pyridoxamine 5'-phosphate oxidase family protein [Campylobacterota bacterium]